MADDPGSREIMVREIRIRIEHDPVTKETTVQWNGDNMPHGVFHETFKSLIEMARRVAARNPDPLSRSHQERMFDAVALVVTGFEAQLSRARHRTSGS